jgi:hypothetical protein
MDALIKIGDALREYEVKLAILGPGERHWELSWLE